MTGQIRIETSEIKQVLKQLRGELQLAWVTELKIQTTDVCDF